MPPPFQLTYFDPPEELARHVLVLFHFSMDLKQIRDLQPGGLGQLVLFPYGQGSITFGNRTDEVTDRAFLMSGFSAAAPFRMEGPWHAIGASLSPLGWAALTGSPASKHIDRFFPAGELLGEDAATYLHGLCDAYVSEELTGQEVARRLGSWIAPRLAPVPNPHELLIEKTINWLGSSLNPSVNDLFDMLAYSRRQAERLVERYFCLPPAALARKFRALRAAAMLANEAITDAEEAVIADAFYDQPHMVHEIRRFCGYTPARLGGEGQPIMKTLLQLKNYTRLQEFRAEK